MTIILALVVLLAAIVVGGRGFYVWNNCGYDCAAIPLFGLSATISMLIGLALAALGVVLLLTVLLDKGK
jgi:hypothetical protein